MQLQRPARIEKLEIVCYLSSQNKDADQTAQMHRSICTFVFCIWHEAGSHCLAYIRSFILGSVHDKIKFDWWELLSIDVSPVKYSDSD